MTTIRMKELKQLSNKELESKLTELNKELINIRSEISSKQTPDSPGRVKELKRTIARVKTLKHLRGDK